MSSAFAECDAPFGRDACFASDVRFAREKRKTALHFAAKPQYITVCKANCITCTVGANITIETFKLFKYNKEKEIDKSKFVRIW